MYDIWMGSLSPPIFMASVLVVAPRNTESVFRGETAFAVDCTSYQAHGTMYVTATAIGWLQRSLYPIKRPSPKLSVES